MSFLDRIFGRSEPEPLPPLVLAEPVHLPGQVVPCTHLVERDGEYVYGWYTPGYVASAPHPAISAPHTYYPASVEDVAQAADWIKDAYDPT